MKTLEMEIALMKYQGVRQNIIVPNVFWSFFNHEADLLVLTKSSYATEIEIKVSKADLKKDKEKWHGHKSDLIKYLDFAVPIELKDFALTEIPEHAGLLSVVFRSGRYWVKREKGCTKNKNCRKWTVEERYRLSELGCMRILGLKEKILRRNK